MEQLLRVPGIGAKGAYKIVTARKYAKLTFEDLKKMRIVLKRARHFITCNGKFCGTENPDRVRTQLILAERTDSAKQLSMFDASSLPPANSFSLLDSDTARLSKPAEESALTLFASREDKQFLLNSSPETAKSALTGEL